MNEHFMLNIITCKNAFYLPSIFKLTTRSSNIIFKGESDIALQKTYEFCDKNNIHFHIVDMEKFNSLSRKKGTNINSDKKSPSV